jgi:tripartite-type tricarboxylate transporter receptor subunit TctC
MSLLGAAGAWPTAALAQSPYPVRSVRILVPSTPGGAPLILTSSDFADLIHQDYEKYGRLIKEIGVKID